MRQLALFESLITIRTESFLQLSSTFPSFRSTGWGRSTCVALILCDHRGSVILELLTRHGDPSQGSRILLVRWDRILREDRGSSIFFSLSLLFSSSSLILDWKNPILIGSSSSPMLKRPKFVQDHCSFLLIVFSTDSDFIFIVLNWSLYWTFSIIFDQYLIL